MADQMMNPAMHITAPANEIVKGPVYTARRVAAETLPSEDDIPLVCQKFDDVALIGTWVDEDGTFSVWGPEPLEAITITESIAEDSATDGTETISRPSRRRQCRRSSCAYNYCNGERLECSSKNTARGSVCETLVESLEWSKSRDWIREKPRNYCLQNDKGKCCVTWRTKVRGDVRIDELVPAARHILDECPDGDNMVSGKIDGWAIGKVCTTLCLSKRPDKC